MRASEVPAGAQLRQRHRNNPAGAWQPLASLAERLPQRVVEVRVVVMVPLSRADLGGFESERWVSVVFPRGGNRVSDPDQQRRAGQASGRSRNEKRKKESEKKLNAKG